MMLLKDAVHYMKAEDRNEIKMLVSRCHEIELILTNDANCDKIALNKEKRQLHKRVAVLLSEIEKLRQKLENEGYNDRKSISYKRERKPLGLFGGGKKKSLGSRES